MKVVKVVSDDSTKVEKKVQKETRDDQFYRAKEAEQALAMNCNDVEARSGLNRAQQILKEQRLNKLE